MKIKSLDLSLYLFSLVIVALVLLRPILAQNQGIASIGALKDISQPNLFYFFLIWNLFLAWIPYWLAQVLVQLHKRPKSIVFLVLTWGLWLLFFPNAPYIITDLIHLKPRWPIPLWYDAMLLFFYSWAGLILGFLSLNSSS